MAKVQARLDEMQAQFDAAMAQKQLLEDDAAACQKKMDSAAALLYALAGEGCLSVLQHALHPWHQQYMSTRDALLPQLHCFMSCILIHRIIVGQLTALTAWPSEGIPGSIGFGLYQLFMVCHRL